MEHGFWLTHSFLQDNAGKNISETWSVLNKNARPKTTTSWSGCVKRLVSFARRIKTCGSLLLPHDKCLLPRPRWLSHRARRLSPTVRFQPWISQILIKLATAGRLVMRWYPRSKARPMHPSWTRRSASCFRKTSRLCDMTCTSVWPLCWMWMCWATRRITCQRSQPWGLHCHHHCNPPCYSFRRLTTPTSTWYRRRLCARRWSRSASRLLMRFYWQQRALLSTRPRISASWPSGARTTWTKCRGSSPKMCSRHGRACSRPSGGIGLIFGGGKEMRRWLISTDYFLFVDFFSFLDY